MINFLINIFNFFINEIKIIKFKIHYLIHYLKEINWFKFFNKNKFFFKNENFNKYLKKNTLIWNRQKINKNKLKEKVLIEGVIFHPGNTIPHCIIGKKVAQFYNTECVGLVRVGDFETIAIMKSFGINEFIFLNRPNFIYRFIFFIKTLFILKNQKNFFQISNLKINKIEIGKTVLEHHIRHTKNPILKKINSQFKIFFSEALFINNFFIKIFKNNNFKHLITSEYQFIPHRIMWQRALSEKINILCRCGDGKGITVRKYTKLSDKNSAYEKVSNKFMDFLFKNFKKKILLKSNKYINSILDEKKFGTEIILSFTKNNNSKVFKDKQDLYNYFNWDKKKPIVLVLPHVLIDGIFNFESSVFNSATDWYIETLKKIKNIKTVNWLIKSHPSEILYKAKLNSYDLFYNIVGKKENINIFPKNFYYGNIYKFVDKIITSHGSSGYEYTALGIPSITAARRSYGQLNIGIGSNSKKKYFKKLENIIKIKPQSKNEINKAKVFWYIIGKLFVIDLFCFPTTDVSKGYDKIQYWKNILKYTNYKKQKKSKFDQYFFTQLKLKNRHTVNIELLNKNLKEIKLNDI